MNAATTTQTARTGATERKPHPDALTAIILAGAGFITLGLASPFAWWKANQANRGIDADPDYDGRGLAQIARVLGIAGTAFLVVWLLLGITSDVLPVDVLRMLRTGLNQALGPNAIVYALAAIGLNVHFGYTGLLNFGQAGFMAVGAYGLAVSVAMVGIPFWGGVAVALVASVTLAIVLGFPTLRLRADYLAIATIASAEILRLIFGSVELSDQLGGSNGITGYSDVFQNLNPYDSGIDLGFLAFGARDLWSITVGWTLVAICVLIVWR